MKQPVALAESVRHRSAHSMEILVLNKVWYPINLVPATRGLCMLFEGSAHAIDESYTQHDFDSWLALSDTSLDGEDNSFIQTPSRKILVPSVLVLRTFDKVPKTKAKLSRTNIYKRDGFQCQYCGQHLSRARLTIDHVLPKSKGGVTSWTNCVASCLRCNAAKADKSLAEAGLTLPRAPFEPDGRHMAAIHMDQRKRPMWGKFL